MGKQKGIQFYFFKPSKKVELEGNILHRLVTVITAAERYDMLFN